MTRRASPDAMDALHRKLAEVLAEGLEGTTEIVDGKAVTLPPPASWVNVARQFLKDNGVDASVPEGSPLDKIRAALPKHDDSEYEDTPFH